MSAPVSHAAALMSADQYRQAADRMLIEASRHPLGDDQPRIAEYLVGCAQVYALLAISAQAAANREDVPF